MPAKPKLTRKKGISITLDLDLLPKIQRKSERMDITVSQYLRRLAKQDLALDPDGDGLAPAPAKKAA